MAQNILTASGFNRPTLAELVKRVGDNVSVVVGPVNRDPDSGTGQLIGVYAEALGITFETAEHLFLSRFISSAEGMALDSLGEWLGGNARRGKTKTRVNVILYGANGTPVPAGSLATYNNHLFETASDVVISTSNTTDITFRFVQQASGTVGVRINGVDYQTSATAIPSSITATLAANITTAGAVTGGTGIYATADGANLRVRSPNVNTGTPISAVGLGVTIVTVGTPALMTAQENGPIVVPANLLVTPVSAISGWTGINNTEAGATGSDRENDTSYRSRLLSTKGASLGKATPGAIKVGLLAVSGVTSATVIVNNKMTTSADGQPGKSYMAVVSGGLSQEVGQAIWDLGGAGIETYGDVTVVAVDENNQPQVVKFSRVTAMPVNVSVAVDGLSTEEIQSTGLGQLIEQGVRAYFSTLGLGDNVVPQRMFGYIYNVTEGIVHMTIKAGKPGTTLVDTETAVPPDEIATVGTITVTGV